MPRQPSADERWMARAISLARLAEGLTRPNPPVGAVIVKQGRVIGEGFHRKAGGPHAEVYAFRKAGPRARGATLYVTLEPCSTQGRTPPCTAAILRNGIKRVVFGVPDPNPAHAGRATALLKRAGIAVTHGVLGDACAALIEPFRMHQTEKRPFVTLKLGITLDGRIADAKGQSHWITGAEARKQVHALRRRVDAILVGCATAAADNPSLLPVPSRGRKPWRVVLDARGRVPLRHRLFSDGLARQTLVITSPRSSHVWRDTLASRGVTVESLPAKNGRFAMRDVMRLLGQRGILHVLCEGGGELAASLVREQLVDEAWFFIAPKVLGADARPAFGGIGWPLARAPGWRIVDISRAGVDVWLRARPED
ncbi:MAG TPA: bifunctional diaminohydroxyphosphoribosylaminopyrimidine deaminase/5-amino-6-(5-phosphoribosylamino)uracil reductase RibD [Kiritimatiellia bacterium]|nr:bifunctional diaminohydroxyphosphoribosylaminopyrimidine deaminase/5-amino-6-(5-phosphoribosylamino)uracil reductase RibD [Kiritimatiellia bacterium]